MTDARESIVIAKAVKAVCRQLSDGKPTAVVPPQRSQQNVGVAIVRRSSLNVSSAKRLMKIREPSGNSGAVFSRLGYGQAKTAKARLGSAKARLGSAKARLGSAKARLGSTKARLGSAKARLGSAKARLGYGQATTKARLGFGQANPSRANPRPNTRTTKEFPNFRIVADVTDNDNSVIVQSPTNSRGRFHRNAIDNLPISRTIRNNLASEFVPPARKQRINRDVVGVQQGQQQKRNRNSGKEKFVNAPVFRNALQEVERSREESNEIVSIQHRPVLDRLSTASTSKSSNSGFIVRVTNLSETVTDEDVEELFSSIGPLVGSKLIRRGVGQATFVRVHDAKRAVDEFNNRELDGVAMKCTLVNDVKRAETLTSPLQSRPRPPVRAPAKETPKNAIEIDRNLFSEAMFRQTDSTKTNGVNSSAAVVQFTVKI